MMKVEYFLFGALFVVVVAFIVLLYIFAIEMKRKSVARKIENFGKNNSKKITEKELTKIVKYIEKNKKYIIPSLYKKGMSNIEKAKVRMSIID